MPAYIKTTENPRVSHALTLEKRDYKAKYDYQINYGNNMCQQILKGRNWLFEIEF
jgi:hypothetical protein